MHPMESAALDIARKKTCGGSGVFDKPYLDAAFNGSLFFWDTCMMAPWAKYHADQVPIYPALDNFYKVQEADGYICREYLPDGSPIWDKNHPISVNPPILTWAELEMHSTRPDPERLARVYPKLAAFHRYLHKFQGDDGLYFSDAHGSGMDNLARSPKDWRPDGKGIPLNLEACDPSVRTFAASRHAERLHWTPLWNRQGRTVDFTAQMAFDAKQLARMAGLLGQDGEAAAWSREADEINARINHFCWNAADGFYYDLGFGRQVGRMYIGAFWTLISGAACEPAQVKGLCDALRDPRKFGRPVPVPSLPADDPEYKPWGAYWRGGVWPPTNYMVLLGLREQGQEDLARELAARMFASVETVFRHTGTFWEDYAPEFQGYGNPSRPDFCGWSALIPIAVRREFLDT